MTSDNFLKCKRLSVKSSVWSANHLVTEYYLCTSPSLCCLFLFVLLQDMTNVLFTVTCTAGPWTTRQWVKNLAPFVSRGAWRQLVPWTRKKWWKKLEKCWIQIAVIMNSAKISCCSVAMAILQTPITCSGRWKCANFLACRWMGFASNVSPAHRLTSRTSPRRLRTSWSCDKMIWFECGDLRKQWRAEKSLETIWGAKCFP